MYEINWQPKARKQVRKINDLAVRLEIEGAVDDLQQWPACTRVKALANHQYEYRLRVGRFRILFDVDTAIRIIDIQEVKKRDDHTY